MATAATSRATRDFRWLAINIPCQNACPAETDIPGYLEAIYQGDFAGAYEINLRDNVFPAVLGRVCSRPCENACRHGREGNGEAVAICFSKRSAADFQHRPPVVLPPLFRDSGKRVAVVGAGPAGLAAARELARFGHRVTVFERHGSPGGMLNQAIPVFRLPRDIIEREIAQITALGVDIRCGVRVGDEVPLQQLAGEYDAVVLAAGTQKPNMTGLPGEQSPGVEHALPFLLQVNELGRTGIGANAIVIGGGYTAMDCARTALRLGARTQVFYRRGREDMVVLPGELEELLHEGGVLQTHCTPTAFLTSNGRLSGVCFRRTRAVDTGSRGKRRIAEIPGSEFDVPAETVILATGQFPDTSWTDMPRLLDDRQRLANDGDARTGLAHVFAAGDFSLGPTTIIQAVAHARECARRVDEFLMQSSRLQQVVQIGAMFQSKARDGRTTGRRPEMNRIPLHPMPTCSVSERGREQEVELGYPEPTAVEAASRCYLCHYKFEILDDRCVLCDECVRVKPVPGCIVEVSALHQDEHGAVIGYDKVVKGSTASLYYSRLWIDQNQCVRCGACEAACPVNAITIQKVRLETSTAACGETHVPVNG